LRTKPIDLGLHAKYEQNLTHTHIHTLRTSPVLYVHIDSGTRNSVLFQGLMNKT